MATKKQGWEFGDELRKAAGQISNGADSKLAAILAEEPVPLSVFVQDAKYLGNPPLSPVQYDAVRHIERIYYANTYPLLAAEFETGKKQGRLHIASADMVWREEKYWSQPLRMINFACLQWAKGAGKDHSIRIALLRISYLLLCLRSPQVYYGMPEQDTIHLLNVASTAPQAQQAFFTPIVRAVKRADNWFADKVTPRQNTISFAKNIEAVSGHSDAESQEGLNLLLGVADEIDAFKSKKEMTGRGASQREPTKSAEGILNMMKSSSSTRFPEVFKNVRISYPRYLGSMIQRLTEEARADYNERGQKSRHYVSGPMATWEVNPRVKGREAFADDYREDAVQARAKYECKPSRAINPYFRNVQAVDAAFEWVDQQPLAVSYALDAQTNSDRRVWSPRYSFSTDFYPVRGAIYTLHADLAVAGDRAGIAMAHVVDYTEHETIATDDDGATHTVREVRPKVKADFVISFSADNNMDPPREIQIRWARQLCLELIRRGFNIRLMSFDSFQSVDSMQILESKGIETKKVSTDLSEEPWRNLRDLMYEGRLSIPRLRTLDVRTEKFLLREELLALSRMPNGRIDHPANGCFVGETRIPLSDDDAALPEIKSLVGQGDVWVYSAQPDGTVVPARARARETKKVTQLVDVVLDSGYSARCTPEHRWMLRGGTYRPAVDLASGDRLMRDFNVRCVLPVELDEPVPVYDLEVDEWHNFALAGGVFVHNSKDLADALAGAVMTAVQLGGREEDSRERRFYEPSSFATGGKAELPFGVSNLRKVWVSSLPSAF